METIKVIRADGPTRDKFGQTLEPSESQTTVKDCLVAPGASVEFDDLGRDGAKIIKTVYAPLGTVVSHLDEVEIDGERFQVTAPPAVWESPFGGHSGVVIPLSQSKG